MKVSVVIPVYNASLYLRQCIDSILRQTLTDFELICVNDGSTDNSLDILKSYDDPRIKIIDKENTGAGDSRNVGMKVAKGDYLSILDADDFFDPKMLEVLYNEATSQKVDIVVCGYRMYNDKLKKTTGTFMTSMVGVGKPEEFGNDLLSMQSPNAWTKLFKTSFIRKYELQFDNVPYCNDMAFVYSSLFCASSISVIEDVLVNYRFFTATQASANKPQNLSLLVKSLLTTKEVLVKNNLYKKFESIFIEGIRSRLQHELHAGMAHNKREAIKSLKDIIPKEFYDKMFYAKTAISVIVPVYNVEPFLKECLDSLIHQTLKNIEIICVNDGSTDGSLSILKEYEKKDKRIKVITQENKGLPVARRTATAVATGEYLQFVDSDDYIDLDTCECLYTYAKLYDHDMLSFQAIDFNSETRKETRTPYHSLRWVTHGLNHTFTWRDIKNSITSYAATACLTLYKKSFLEANNIEWVNKKLCYEDTPFFTKSVFLAKRVGVLKEAFYHRRIHNQSITQNKSAHFLDYLESITLALDEVKKYAPSLLKQYVRLFLGVAFRHYLTFDTEVKQPFIKPFVETIRHIVHTHCKVLPKTICRWYKSHR